MLKQCVETAFCQGTTHLPTYVPTYLCTYIFLTAATAFLHDVCTTGRDHDRTGALRPAQLNQLKYLHTYLSTASEDYINTNIFPATYGVSHSIKEKTVRQNQ